MLCVTIDTLCSINKIIFKNLEFYIEYSKFSKFSKKNLSTKKITLNVFNSIFCFNFKKFSLGSCSSKFEFGRISEKVILALFVEVSLYH